MTLRTAMPPPPPALRPRKGHAFFEGESSLDDDDPELDAAGAIKPMPLKATDLTNHVPANCLQLTES